MCCDERQSRLSIVHSMMHQMMLAGMTMRQTALHALHCMLEHIDLFRLAVNHNR